MLEPRRFQIRHNSVVEVFYPHSDINIGISDNKPAIPDQPKQGTIDKEKPVVDFNFVDRAVLGAGGDGPDRPYDLPAGFVAAKGR